MLDNDFEELMQGKQEPPKALILKAVPFIEFFANDAQNEFWNADGTLLKRLSRYKDFCKQPLKMGMLEKYFECNISKVYEADLVRNYHTMNDLLNHLYITFKPEFAAFFNLKN
jgi:hypothetical protein